MTELSEDSMTFAPPGRWAGSPVRYPDVAVRVLDERFAQLRIGLAAVELLWTGSRWGEGPVWFGDHRTLVWSDIPNNRMLRWDEQTGEVSVFRAPSNFANGNTRDGFGRLVTCEHQTRRVTRTEHDGTVAVLADAFDGEPLNAPNDVVVAADGAIWFTDPGYGILSNYEGDKAEPALPTRVYRVDPHGTMTVATEGLDRPNGLAFSPDGSRLYVVDSGVGKIHGFAVRDGNLGNPETFVDMAPGTADGIRVDRHGNLWAACFTLTPDLGDGYNGVHVFAPDGARIGQICLPEACSNLCFGGRRGNRLFMTASQSLYSLYVNL